jgi:hypothetical protein
MSAVNPPLCKLTHSCDRELRSISVPFDKFCVPNGSPTTYTRAQPSRWSVLVDVWRMKKHHHLSSMREDPSGKQATRESVPTQLRMPPCVTTRGLVRKVSGRAVGLSRCPLFNRFLILMALFRSTNVFRPPAAVLRAGEFNIKR